MPDIVQVVEDTWRIELRNGTRGPSSKGIRTMHITQKSAAVVTYTVPTVSLADPGAWQPSGGRSTAESTTHREACPTWCIDRDLRCGCDGDHWSDSGQVNSVTAINSLDVFLHQDRECHWQGRHEAEMDAEPHVLLRVYGAGGALDRDARMTAGEARNLAGLLMDAAGTLDGADAVDDARRSYGPAYGQFRMGLTPVLERRLHDLLAWADRRRIRIDERDLVGSNSNMAGCWLPDDNLIWIDHGLTVRQWVSTLAHECAHAFFEHVGTVPEQEDAANSWAAERLVSAEAFDRAAEQHGANDVRIAQELEVMVWVVKTLRCQRQQTHLHVSAANRSR